MCVHSFRGFWKFYKWLTPLCGFMSCVLCAIFFSLNMKLNLTQLCGLFGVRSYWVHVLFMYANNKIHQLFSFVNCLVNPNIYEIFDLSVLLTLIRTNSKNKISTVHSLHWSYRISSDKKTLDILTTQQMSQYASIMAIKHDIWSNER